MKSNKPLLTSSILAISLFASDAMAQVATSCGDISEISAVLRKYAVNDPTNYSIRARTLAESYPCMRDDVMRASDVIAKQQGLVSGATGYPQPPSQVTLAEPQVLQQADAMPARQAAVPTGQMVGPVAVKPAAATGSHSGMFGISWLAWGGVAALVGGTAVAVTAFGQDRTERTSAFITKEYRAQYTLDTMDAEAAYERGFAGSGKQIAVVDTGLDTTHPEFANGRVIPGAGFDFVNNVDGQPDAGSLDPHGTEVAGVIAANRDGIGMHGVAYDATIVPLRVFDGSATAISDFTDAINYAKLNTRARVLNGSFGFNDDWHNTYEPLGYQGYDSRDISEAVAYKSYVAAGGILVFAAGNAYQIAPGLASNPTSPGFLPFVRPENASIVGAVNGAYRHADGSEMTNADFSSLQPQTIVVASVDQKNVISSFSNRCGVAKDWCMVAPGEGIYTTTIGGGYTTVSGTSFAAPQVSGALAVLKQEFPNLTPAQIVSRLLNTATDLGDPGVDAIYGHGLLNLAAASNPVGITGISTTGLMAGNIIPIADSTLSYGHAFGGSISSAFNGMSVLVLDSYGAGFSTSLRGRITSATSNFDTHGAFDSFIRPDERQEMSFGGDTKLGFTSENNVSSDHIVGDKPRDENDISVEYKHFSLSQSFSSTDEGSVHYKDTIALSLGFSDADRVRADRALNKDALENPYAAFAGDGFASIYKTEGLGSNIKVAGFYGHSKDDEQANNFGTQAELDYKLDKGTAAYVSLGSLFEENRVLGSKGTGALAFGNGTSTVYMGLGGKVALDDNLTLRAAGYAGMTNPSINADNSLIKSASEIITSSFNAAIDKAGSFFHGDTLGVGVSQPLRVESGNMQFDVPVMLDEASGYTSLISQHFTQDLSAQGREMDFELNYAVPTDKDESLAAGALYRMDAGHVAGKNDVLGVMRWSKRF